MVRIQVDGSRRQRAQIHLIGHHIEVERIQLQRDLTSGYNEGCTCLPIIIMRKGSATTSNEVEDKLVIRGRQEERLVISRDACTDVVQA